MKRHEVDRHAQRYPEVPAVAAGAFSSLASQSTAPNSLRPNARLALCYTCNPTHRARRKPPGASAALPPTDAPPAGKDSFRGSASPAGCQTRHFLP
jgi:hypothetical protein